MGLTAEEKESLIGSPRRRILETTVLSMLKVKVIPHLHSRIAKLRETKSNHQLEFYSYYNIKKALMSHN